MIFGRQNNMRRRAFRPNGSDVRATRRKSVKGFTLLDAVTAPPPDRSGPVARLMDSIRRWVTKR